MERPSQPKMPGIETAKRSGLSKKVMPKVALTNWLIGQEMSRAKNQASAPMMAPPASGARAQADGFVLERGRRQIEPRGEELSSAGKGV